MKKQSSSEKNAKEDIYQLRVDIDDIDSRIIELIKVRFEKTDQIGSLKLLLNSDVYDGQREAYILDRYSKLARRNHVDEELCINIFNEIMRVSKKQQNNIKQKI